MGRPTNAQRGAAIAEAFEVAAEDIEVALEALGRVQTYLSGPAGKDGGGREVALAVTKAQEAQMWFAAAREARA